MDFEIRDTALNGFLRIRYGVTPDEQPWVVPGYTFLWNQGGVKRVILDYKPIRLSKDTIFSLSPGQVLSISGKLSGCLTITFNREFYCIQDHDREVSCNGILFNGALPSPLLRIRPAERRSFDVLVEVMKEEIQNKDEIQLEMLRTVLKRFIIKCTRLAKLQYASRLLPMTELDTFRQFNVLVEKNFRTFHKVHEYANLMNKSPKTLANVFAKFGNQPPLQVIHARLILEAKKLLLYTDKPMKEIAFELNLPDPVQFSRMFKKETGQTPGDFRREGLLHP